MTGSFYNTNGFNNTNSNMFGLNNTSTNNLFGSNLFGNTMQAEPPKIEDVKIPTELTNKSFGDVLSTIEKNLEEQSESFQKQARIIARWDRKIYDCMELVRHLERQITKTYTAQQDLQRSATELLQKQDELIKKMANDTSQPSNISGPEDQRNRIYRLAQHLGNKYSDMESQLKEMVDHIEKSQHLSEVSSDMDKISKITNCHMNSLQWIANQSDVLDKRIEDLSKKLSEDYFIPQ